MTNGPLKILRYVLFLKETVVSRNTMLNAMAHALFFVVCCACIFDFECDRLGVEDVRLARAQDLGTYSATNMVKV